MELTEWPRTHCSECIVYGRSAASHISQAMQERTTQNDVDSWDASQVIDSDENVVVAHNWAEIRRFMWDYVGIVRTEKRLRRALNRMQLLAKEIQDFCANYRITADLIELRNLVVRGRAHYSCGVNARGITRAALHSGSS